MNVNVTSIIKLKKEQHRVVEIWWTNSDEFNSRRLKPYLRRVHKIPASLSKNPTGLSSNFG